MATTTTPLWGVEGGAAIKAASCLPLGRLNVSPIDRQMTFQWRRIRPKKEGEFHNAGDLTVDSPSLSLTEQAGRRADCWRLAATIYPALGEDDTIA